MALYSLAGSPSAWRVKRHLNRPIQPIVNPLQTSTWHPATISPQQSAEVVVSIEY